MDSPHCVNNSASSHFNYFTFIKESSVLKIATFCVFGFLNICIHGRTLFPLVEITKLHL